jgi:hypothetical protein
MPLSDRIEFWQRAGCGAQAIVALLAVLASSLVGAGPVDDLNPVGEARLRVFFFHIYDSTLYSPSGRYEGVNPDLALQIEYQRSIAADRLLDQTREEWRKQSLYEESCEAWLSKLDSFWPDVSRGDTLTLRVDDSLASEFYLNGKLIGEIQDARFTERFLAIWLSEDSSYPRLRNQLVGAG